MPTTVSTPSSSRLASALSMIVVDVQGESGTQPAVSSGRPERGKRLWTGR